MAPNCKNLEIERTVRLLRLFDSTNTCCFHRMYGRLTGLSKLMVQQRHGDEQFRAWRRGYNTPPPPVSSFSQHYPGNDPRYEKYLTDVRYSFRESTIRSIEKGKFQLHRKFPKSESLKDCMGKLVVYTFFPHYRVSKREPFLFLPVA